MMNSESILVFIVHLPHSLDQVYEKTTHAKRVAITLFGQIAKLIAPRSKP